MTTLAPSEIIRGIRPGTLVKFLVPGGLTRHGRDYTTRTGRVVMNCGTHLVVNAGGPHGTSKIVSEENLSAFGRTQLATPEQLIAKMILASKADR